MELQYNILDDERRALLPLFTPLKTGGFYLAGGTALALMLGHRDSVDFDFFTCEHIDTIRLFEQLKQLFRNHALVKTQEEKGTLSVLVDGSIRMSFFEYPYPLIEPLLLSDYFDLASLPDIACMKLSAITSRAALKDYVDLYFILEKITLKDIIAALRQKMPELDPLLALKSLTYFADLQKERIIFKTRPVSLSDIQARLMHAVTEYPKGI